MGSRNKLLALAYQLRLREPRPESIGDEEVEQSGGRNVVSRAGSAESALKVATSSLKGGGGEARFRPKRAAVLVCLFEGEEGEFRVILTKRASRLSIHSGEVSLPGGKAEEGDKDDAETATREAKEEIGLDPSLVDVVTCLEPFLSKHSLKVVPVIGILANKEAFQPRLNPAEVEDIFDAPLEMFLEDKNRRGIYGEFLGEEYLVHFFDYEFENKKFVIWGVTSAILIRAASVVYQRPPAFLEQNPEFKNNDETLRRYLVKSRGDGHVLLLVLIFISHLGILPIGFRLEASGPSWVSGINSIVGLLIHSLAGDRLKAMP
ncbi:hypothetical protein MLD38_019304 [Melastoma candidum]|uniref:Uncharacterized protein n=1 Tax=Melastoma candidum TaxID=119954 RepID=A0ACB9QXW3_9MYRT|nr:hypothetical protein MLD38_019304 [Melastoma candidum]